MVHGQTHQDYNLCALNCLPLTASHLDSSYSIVLSQHVELLNILVPAHVRFLKQDSLLCAVTSPQHSTVPVDICIKDNLIDEVTTLHF